jgi:Clostripain family
VKAVDVLLGQSIPNRLYTIFFKGEHVMKEWTVMVYMAGDNNLSVDMAYAVDQIKSVTKNNQNINLYVYYDGFSDTVPTLYCDFSDPALNSVKFYRSINIKDKLIKRKTRRENGFNENSASINNILNFVDWCVKKDKYSVDKDGKTGDKRGEKKYAMIFSGHTFGFMDWGLFKDEKADYYMTLSKLTWMFERITLKEDKLVELAQIEQDEEKEEAQRYRRGFKEWSADKVTERTTEILGKPLDILGFDSCEMSSLEIGSQFKGLAQTMVASEGSVPNAGWNYAQVLLGKLKDKSDSDPEDIAVSFVDEFIKQQNCFALADISVDMAAWDLNALDALTTSFGSLVDDLVASLDDKNPVSYHQMRRLLAQVHWQCQTFLLEQYIDLGDFCGILSREIGLLRDEVDVDKIPSIINAEKSCKQVIDGIKKCILLTGFSGSDFQFSNGISLFFPWSLASYESAEKDYEKLSFIKNNNVGEKWNQFLRYYLSQVTLRHSNPLTPMDKDGYIIVDPNTESVVYESYTLLNEEHKNSDPRILSSSENSKRPPNAARRPPNSAKMMSDNLSIFLSRFMKLKNFQTNWNQAGFASNKVTFTPTGQSSPQREGSPIPEDVAGRPTIAVSKPNIVIPKGETIEATLDEIRAKMTDLSKFNLKSVNIDDLIWGEDLTNPSILKMLRSVSRKLNFKSTQAEFSLKGAFERSITPITDETIRVSLLEKLKKPSPK